MGGQDKPYSVGPPCPLSGSTAPTPGTAHGQYGPHTQDSTWLHNLTRPFTSSDLPLSLSVLWQESFSAPSAAAAPASTPLRLLLLLQASVVLTCPT